MAAYGVALRQVEPWPTVPAASTTIVIFMAVFTGAFGWVNGWLNEKLGGGSILPGWAAHGTANLCAYMAMALFLV